MVNDYLSLTILLITATVLAVLVVIIGHLFGPRRPSERKNATYESGMAPIGPGTRRMPVRFYLVAVLFILFDIEVVFLLPWSVILRSFSSSGKGLYALAVMGIFLLVLTVGLIYEWKKGAMEWE
jgi:NADH-quinone oxidoreductase subunit A